MTRRREDPSATTGTSDETEIPKSFICPLSGNIFTDPVVLSDGKTYERSAVVAASDDNDEEKVVKKYPNRALRIMIQESVVFPNRKKKKQAEEEDDKYKCTIDILNGWLDGVANLLPRRRRDDLIENENATEEENSRNESNNETSEIDENNNNDNENDDGDDDNNEESKPLYRPPAHLPRELFCPITSDLLLKDPVIDPDGHSYGRESIFEWLRLQEGTSPITRQPLSVENLLPNVALKDYLEEEKSLPPSKRHPMIQEWMEEERSFRQKYHWLRQSQWNPVVQLRAYYRREGPLLLVFLLLLMGTLVLWIYMAMRGEWTDTRGLGYRYRF